MKKLLTKLFNRQNIPNSNNPIPMPNSSGKDFKKKKKNPIGFIVAIVFVIGGIIGGQYFLSRQSGEPVKGAATVNNKKQEASIEKSFSFRAFNRSKKLSKKKVGYTVTSAEKTNQIIIKGKRATAVNGRTFLIINLKLTNEYEESLFLNTRNYIRVQAEGTDDKLAPEIHNDTVEIQPDSTKVTRVGMPIDESQEKFTLFVGEVDDDEKEEIFIEF